jgi:hypothetical protein
MGRTLLRRARSLPISSLRQDRFCKQTLNSRILIARQAVGSCLLVHCGLVFLALALLQRLQAQSTIALSPATSPAAGQPGITTLTVIGSNLPSGTIAAAAIRVTLQPAVPTQVQENLLELNRIALNSERSGRRTTDQGRQTSR